MTRRERQLDQLRALCTAGQVDRAVDLAFEHFATFGRDERVIDLLSAAVDDVAGRGVVRGRLDELSTSLGGGPGSDQRPSV